MGSQERRPIYTATLESHIDRLHDQLLEYSLTPASREELKPYYGLNAMLAKVGTFQTSYLSDILNFCLPRAQSLRYTMT